MRTIAQIVLLFLFASSLSAEVVNRVILRVNDRIATLHDYERLRAERIRELLGRTNLDSDERQGMMDEVGNSVMREIFDELLILSRSDQLAVTVSELEVDQAMGRMRENAKIDTEDQFRAALAQSGMTLEDLRRQLLHRLLFDEVMGREISPRIQIGDEELRAYYREHQEAFRLPEEVQIKEIVVLEQDSLSAQELGVRAEEIRSLLVQGQDLEEVASQYEGQVSPVIEVGWVKPGDLDPVLEKAIWELGIGSTSQPVEARGGLHLCQILGRRESIVRPYEDVQERIAVRLRQERFQDEIQDYLKELEDQSFIIGSVPEEAKGFRTAAGRSIANEGFPFLESAEEGDGEEAPAETSESEKSEGSGAEPLPR